MGLPLWTAAAVGAHPGQLLRRRRNQWLVPRSYGDPGDRDPPRILALVPQNRVRTPANRDVIGDLTDILCARRQALESLHLRRFVAAQGELCLTVDGFVRAIQLKVSGTRCEMDGVVSVVC